MKYFFVVSLVMIGVLVAKSESKDFCEAFKGNGFKIDYSFEHRTIDKESEKWVDSTFKSTVAFIIGKDYWLLEDEGFDIKFKSSDSLTSEVFGNHYLSAFSVIKSRKDFNYGFIRKNDTNIEWKELKGTGSATDFNTMANKIVKTSASPFPQGFQPVISLCEDFVHSFQRQIFWDQKSKGNDVYERKKVILDFINDPEKIESKQVDEYPSVSKGNIIATVGPYDYENNQLSHMMFFVVNHSIEYCYQDFDKRYGLDLTCSKERKGLADCSQSPGKYFTAKPSGTLAPVSQSTVPPSAVTPSTAPQSNGGLNLLQIIAIVLAIFALK